MDIFEDKKKLAIYIIAFIAVLFVLFVWPTLYRYEKMKSGTVEHMIRINRVTGSAERLYSGGWQ